MSKDEEIYNPVQITEKENGKIDIALRPKCLKCDIMLQGRDRLAGTQAGQAAFECPGCATIYRFDTAMVYDILTKYNDERLKKLDQSGKDLK